MKEPEIPQNEEERLKKLKYYEVLDTLPEQEFDDLVQLASHICGTPIALVSLVDSDRQWFKASTGLDAQETPRNISFCGHAIHGEEVFEVENALEDARFSDNPLVSGSPDIRFYAGAPLITPEKLKIGTLCVIDQKAKSLSPEQKEHLKALSRVVVRQLEIRLHNRELKKALNVKDRIMSTLAHELRNPLNGVMGITQTLLDSREHPAIQHELRIISECGDHLLNIVNDILEINRLNIQNYQFQKKPLDLKHEIEACLALMKTSFSHKKLLTEVNFDKNLPTHIEGDSLRIKQVLLNLLGNAFKFTPEGKVFVTVSYLPKEGNTEDDLVRIVIKDTGIGINKTELKNIFLEFVQENEKISQNYGGSGLGLSIAKKLAVGMGGDIEVESEKGKGSSFSFTFKTKKAFIKANEAPNIFNVPENYKILVVDDNDLNLKVIRRMLNRLGFSNVQAANSGEEAINEAQKTSFDLIFMDIYMPEMDGLEASQKLLKMNPNLNIVGLSANSGEVFGKRASEVGMKDYIEKPIQKEYLINALKKML